MPDAKLSDRPRRRVISPARAESQRARPSRRGWWGPAVTQGPSLLVLGVVVLFPLAYSIKLSFQSYSPIIPNHDGQWIGLDNYQRMLHDGDFHHSLIVTGIFVVAAVTLETVLGVIVGILIDRLRRMRRVATSALLLPMILTPLVVGLMFNFALNAQFGYLTFVLEKLGIAEGGALNGSVGALVVLILIDVWEWFPFVALMVVAGLQTIPKEPLEAASIDGASTLQVYWHVTLPLLRPILGIAVLFRATEAIREFDKVFVLTGGGPGSATAVNDLYQYRVSFLNWDLSYGAALGLVTFVAVLGLSGLMYRSLRKKETSR